jgi:hypothetical protein
LTATAHVNFTAMPTSDPCNRISLSAVISQLSPLELLLGRLRPRRHTTRPRVMAASQTLPTSPQTELPISRMSSVETTMLISRLRRTRSTFDDMRVLDARWFRRSHPRRFGSYLRNLPGACQFGSCEWHRPIRTPKHVSNIVQKTGQLVKCAYVYHIATTSPSYTACSRDRGRRRPTFGYCILQLVARRCCR